MNIWEKELYHGYGKISVNEYNRIVIEIGNNVQYYAGTEGIAVVLHDICGLGYLDHIPAGNERLDLIESLIVKWDEALAVQGHTVSVGKPNTKKNEGLLWLKHHGYD